MPRYDHIVVGGGVAGMTCALLFAGQGYRVALVETFPLLAPTIRGFRRQGVHFDTGLHYVGGLSDGDPLDIYFKHLNIANQLVKTPYDPTGFDDFMDETSGRHFSIPCNFTELKRRLLDWFPDEKNAIEHYVAAIKSTMDASPFLNFSRPFDLSKALHAEDITLQDFLDKLTDNDTLKAVLSYQCILYGVPPGEALLSTHALVAGSYHLSAHTVEGGGLALTKAYENRLKALDVDLICNGRVVSIEINDNREVTGVTLENGQRLETSSCIWTAHPDGLIKATPDSAFRPAFKKRLRSLEDTTSALILFGVSEEPVAELDGRNIISWPGTSFEKNLNSQLPAEQSIFYLSAAQDMTSGKTAVTAIMPSAIGKFEQWADSKRGKRPIEYTQFKQAALDSFTDEIFRRMPCLKEKVTFVDGATPLTMKDYCTTPTGSLYGLRHSVNQFNPAPVTKAEGLTLAGQSIVAPGILGAVVSAYLTCGIILGHAVLHDELRRIA